MPLPKVTDPKQVVLGDGTPAKTLVKVVKADKVDPSIVGRMVELAENAKEKV